MRPIGSPSLVEHLHPPVRGDATSPRLRAKREKGVGEWRNDILLYSHREGVDVPQPSEAEPGGER
jgi:hypothetical protein